MTTLLVLKQPLHFGALHQFRNQSKLIFLFRHTIKAHGQRKNCERNKQLHC